MYAAIEVRMNYKDIVLQGFIKPIIYLYLIRYSCSALLQVFFILNSALYNDHYPLLIFPVLFLVYQSIFTGDGLNSSRLISPY